MTNRLDIYAPATITAYNGGTSNLATTPPHGIFLSDPNAGIVTLSATAANAGTMLLASSGGGATISENNNVITIVGLASQVNTALQTLQIMESSTATTDTLSLTATEAGELPTTTAIAINIASPNGPAFASPPASLALTAWAIDPIPGLTIGDPQAQSLTAAGQGAEETLQLTLSVASGILLMPNLSALTGIKASGIGSNQILLTFTASQLAAVNTLLASLSFAGPAGSSALAYALRNLSGPLGTQITSGNVNLGITGTEGATQILISGNDTVILGAESYTAGTTLAIKAITSNIGGINGAAALLIAPDAAFQIPYNTLSLGGTSFDYGTLNASALNEFGTLIAPGNVTIAGILNLGPTSLIDFENNFNVLASGQVINQLGLSLAAGAIVSGDGTLEIGNFSFGGRILGPGTILTAGSQTLVITGGEISGGTQLDIDGGAVLALGPVTPLIGVFDSTPLTIDSSVTINFQGGNGVNPVTGALADALDQRGGVLVIDSPDVFNGTIVNFAPGDRLIFPQLTGLTLLSIASHSFVIAGQDSDDQTVEYTINAAYPSGTSPFVYIDTEGDSEVGLRDTQTDIFLGPSPAQNGLIVATTGVAQPIMGLDLLLRSWTTQSLTITLSVASGTLTEDTLPAASSLTLTAASPAALNAELANLQYTANGGLGFDELQITAASGYLVGLALGIPIDVTTANGTMSGFGDAAQIAVFTGPFSGFLQQAAAPGEILVAGTTGFADALDVDGLGGSALVVDGGGNAIFDEAAAIILGGNVTIGDATGAGQLNVFTNDFSIAGNMTLGANAADTGSAAYITGALNLTGSLSIGAGATSAMNVSGTLAAAATSIASSSTLAFTGSASASLGALTDTGTIIAADQTNATATTANIAGTLILEGGSNIFVQNTATATGLITIGPDADFSTPNFVQTAGTVQLYGALGGTTASIASHLTLAGGTLDIPALFINGGTIAGTGLIEGSGGLSGIQIDNGTIIATGSMDIGGDIFMTGASDIILKTLASVELDHIVTGGLISFTGANAELTIDDLQKFTTPITHMLNHDAIDLTGIAPSEVKYAAGSITVTDKLGDQIGGFSLSAANGQASVQISADGYGGALITLGGDLPCFVRGTRLLTPTGYRPIESLEPGDLVITNAGRPQPIQWLGHRTMDLTPETNDHPIRFAENAIAPGSPSRPVKLSPLHAIYIDNVLVPALHLVNGATIRNEVSGPVTYYHLELARHDIILAEGMAVETYLENGNRSQLYHERGTRAHCATPCAPLITSGPTLALIRHKLHRIALAAGYTLTHNPNLRGIAAQTSLLPKITIRNRRRIARFTLPANAAKLTLTARCAAPADTNPDSEDRRQLGICLNRVTTGELGAGWLPRGQNDEGYWMQSGAELLLPAGIRNVTIELAAVVQSWQQPTMGLPTIRP